MWGSRAEPFFALFFPEQTLEHTAHSRRKKEKKKTLSLYASAARRLVTVEGHFAVFHSVSSRQRKQAQTAKHAAANDSVSTARGSLAAILENEMNSCCFSSTGFSSHPQNSIVELCYFCTNIR